MNDMARLTQKDPKYLRLLLHRLEKKGIIKRIEKNKYTIQDNPYIVASNLAFPSYISFLSAYAFYGLTNQIPTVITIATLKSKKSLLVNGQRAVFVKLKKTNFFGYKKIMLNRRPAFVAEKEKAILDSIYLPRHCPLSETLTAIKESNPNKEILLQYAKRMNNVTLTKRLGYLLEKSGIDIYGETKQQIGNKYSPLNPHLPAKGSRIKKWKLIQNEELQT